MGFSVWVWWLRRWVEASELGVLGFEVWDCRDLGGRVPSKVLGPWRCSWEAIPPLLVRANPT